MQPHCRHVNRVNRSSYCTRPRQSEATPVMAGCHLLILCRGDPRAQDSFTTDNSYVFQAIRKVKYGGGSMNHCENVISNFGQVSKPASFMNVKFCDIK